MSFTCEIDLEKNSDLFDFVHFIGMISSSLVPFEFYDGAPPPKSEGFMAIACVLKCHHSISKMDGWIGAHLLRSLRWSPLVENLNNIHGVFHFDPTWSCRLPL